MGNKKEINNNLEKILSNQNEILKILKSIDNNIVKYFGKEHDLKEKELGEKLIKANLSHKQFKAVKELADYLKENHSENNNVCMTTKLPCCYCQPVCGSRKEVTI